MIIIFRLKMYAMNKLNQVDPNACHQSNSPIHVFIERVKLTTDKPLISKRQTVTLAKKFKKTCVRTQSNKLSLSC